MPEAIVCIGSNVADARQRVTGAIQWLKSLIPDAVHSGPYPTAPEGACAGQREYINAVLAGNTNLHAQQLSAMFKNYEREQGRLPEHKAESRIIIDVDLVCHGEDIVKPAEFNSDYFKKGFKMLPDH